MLYWISFFFLVALVAAACGFGGLMVAAAGSAKAVFFVFMVLGIVSVISERHSPFSQRRA